MRLKEYVDYATAAGDSVTEIQFVRIAYSLVVDTGQFQEDYQNWHAKSDPEIPGLDSRHISSRRRQT